jgi:hypothetical protein
MVKTNRKKGQEGLEMNAYGFRSALTINVYCPKTGISEEKYRR